MNPSTNNKDANMEYDMAEFERLYTAALSPNATPEDLLRMGRWCEKYDDTWNGEYYDLSPEDELADTCRLWPIYAEVDDNQFEIVGYEFR